MKRSTAYERGLVAPGGRSRSDFAGSRSRKSRRGINVGDTGPKPPPVLVLSDDLVDPDEMPSLVFGQFPTSLIPKLLPWLQCDRHEVLHVCSGSLRPGEGIRVDIREDAKPDIIADGRHMPMIRTGSIKAVMVDPPYTEHYARDLYGVEYPRPKHLLTEAARVVRRGGRIVFVHYIVPKPVRGTRMLKTFGLSTGFNYPIRAVSIYERDQAELAL